MTDKELLELAAKAAGIEGKYLYDGYGSGCILGTLEGYPTGIRWEPLVDDGDALRLAVKLGFLVNINPYAGFSSVTGFAVDVIHDDDPFAATRRAIVRAAAAIGGQMQAYCLGYTHEKCETCRHEKNWQILNQMPDALRLRIQNSVHRIDSDKCRLTKMGEYEAMKEQS